MTVRVLQGKIENIEPYNRKGPRVPEGFSSWLYRDGLECDVCGCTIDWIGMTAQEAANRHKAICSD